MKSILIQFLLIISPLSLVCQNTYWVSNDPSDAEIVQYSNLQTAINSVENGDTLMIYPTGINYGNITLNKELHLEGIGYQNDTINQPLFELETIQFTASVNTINISTGSSGSSIHGLYVYNVEAANVTGLTISNTFLGLFRATNCNNVVLIANHIGHPTDLHNRGNNSYDNAEFISTENIILSNNLFYLFYPAPNIRNLWVDGGCGNALIQNNIFLDIGSINNATLLNNIFINSANPNLAEFYNSTLSSNIFDSNIPNLPPGNLDEITPSTLFVGYPIQDNFSFDNRFQLLSDSPAIGYGINGEDCGIFGGEFPYRLSGITTRPIISELIVPTSTYNDEMQISIRVKIID